MKWITCQLLRLCRETSKKQGKAIRLGFPILRWLEWLDHWMRCQSLSWRPVALLFGLFLSWEKQSHDTLGSNQSLRHPWVHTLTPLQSCSPVSVGITAVSPPLSQPATFLVKTDWCFLFHWAYILQNIPLYTFPNFIDRIKWWMGLNLLMGIFNQWLGCLAALLQPRGMSFLRLVQLLVDSHCRTEHKLDQSFARRVNIAGLNADLE